MTGWLQVPLWAQFRSSLRDVLSVGAIFGQDPAACLSCMRVCSANTRAEVSARAAPHSVSLQARAVHKIADHTVDVRARVRSAAAQPYAFAQLVQPLCRRGASNCSLILLEAARGMNVYNAVLAWFLACFCCCLRRACMRRYFSAAALLRTLERATARATLWLSQIAVITRPPCPCDAEAAASRPRVRVQVGSVVSASATMTLQLRPTLQLRGSLFCSGVATRAEVGVSLARNLTRGYAGVGYGTAGTSLNVRLTRAAHTMHVPILLSSRFDDWQALLLATAVPTAINLIVTQCAARPRLHCPHLPRLALRCVLRATAVLLCVLPLHPDGRRQPALLRRRTLPWATAATSTAASGVSCGVS